MEINTLIDCPQCGYPATETNYIAVNNSILFCPWCGFKKTVIDENITETEGFGTFHMILNNKETIIRIENNNTFDSIKKLIDKDECVSAYIVYDYGITTIKGPCPKTLSELYEEESEKLRYYNSFRTDERFDNEFIYKQF